MRAQSMRAWGSSHTQLLLKNYFKTLTTCTLPGSQLQAYTRDCSEITGLKSPSQGQEPQYLY